MCFRCNVHRLHFGPFGLTLLVQNPNQWGVTSPLLGTSATVGIPPGRGGTQIPTRNEAIGYFTWNTMNRRIGPHKSLLVDQSMPVPITTATARGNKTRNRLPAPSPFLPNRTGVPSSIRDIPSSLMYHRWCSIEPPTPHLSHGQPRS